MWWIVMIVIALLIPEVLSTILDSRLGRAIAAQVEARGRTETPEGLADRVRLLEGDVDRLNEDVRRLTEESEFFQKLLSDRSTANQPRLPPRGDITP
jgi:hypothetical protein